MEQQQFLLTHQAKELKNRIVSLPKLYVRPIISGKETKRVEFGMNGDFDMIDSAYTLKQHSAHFTESGDLLAFDNGDDFRGYSRVVSYELNDQQMMSKIKI